MSDETFSRAALEASYNRVAEQYADAFSDELSRKPFDRDLLDRFAERVRGRGSVCDVGCGPGQVARYLAERGVAVRGLDLSPEMVRVARSRAPGIAFERGDMLALPATDGTWAGIVSFYAIIHLSRDEAPRALREFRRVVQPGGWLALAFHGGEGELTTTDWFGEPVAVRATLFTRDEMARSVTDASFTVIEASERAPYPFEYPSQRVYILAQAR